MSNWKYLSEEQKEYLQSLDDLIRQATDLKQETIEMWEMQRAIELIELKHIANQDKKQFLRIITLKNTVQKMKEVHLLTYSRVKYSLKEVKKYIAKHIGPSSKSNWDGQGSGLGDTTG